MKIEKTHILGLKVIYLNKFKDKRGSFVKVLNKDFFYKNGLEADCVESYYSISKKNVIRGMHFQIPPAEHTKLVYVNHGCILDVILDIRKNSPTFGKHFKIKISAENPILVYIPVGCAHGFLSLENNTMVTYLQTSVYDEASDHGIKFDSFGVNWNVENPIISERDSKFPILDDFETPF